MHELDCLFIGVCTQDLMMQVPKLPERNRRIPADGFARCSGGVAANAAAAFAHLGGAAGIITALGDDDTGAFIRADLGAQNYRSVMIHTIPGCASPISAILVEPDGSRSIVHHGGSIRELRFDMMDKSLLRDARIVHMGVLDPDCMLQTARYLKAETDALVSIDAGNLDGRLMDALLPFSDIFIPDEATVRAAYGMDAPDACRYFRGRGPSICCVTRAEQGAFGCDAQGEYQASAPPVRVVDTTAAGDNFHGALLYAISQGRPLEAAMRFACAFASRTCEALGGRAGMPDRRLFEDMLPK